MDKVKKETLRINPDFTFMGLASERRLSNR
jgi:hypothetical protein